MNPHSQFWNTVDALAHDLRQEGDNDVRRAENIATTLERLPAESRQKCLAALARVAQSLPVILTHCQKRDGESG
jgi:hypothetical protein